MVRKNCRGCCRILGLEASSARTTKDASPPKEQAELAQNIPANNLATKSEDSVNSEPRGAAYTQRFIARRQNKRRGPINQRLEEVGYDYWRAEYEFTSQEGALVDGPPQELSIEDLANDPEAVGYYLVLDGGVQISPEAPQSPAFTTAHIHVWQNVDSRILGCDQRAVRTWCSANDRECIGFGS